MAGLFCAGVRPCAAQFTSAPVQNPVNGHWYQAVSLEGDSIDWPTARAEAEALSSATWSAHLVTITSPEEQLFVALSLPVKQQPHWWMGAYQDETAPDYAEPGGGWRWVTGEPWGRYTVWAANNPDNSRNVHSPDGENALEFNTSLSNTGSLWNDFPVNQRIGGYIIEYEPASPPGSVAQVILYPPALVGGQLATGEVRLKERAGPGGVLVPLTSSNPAVVEVPAAVAVPAGAGGVSFPIRTTSVESPVAVVLRAAGAGEPVGVALQVEPRTRAVNLLINGSFEEPRLPGDTPSQSFRAQTLPGWTIRGGSTAAVALLTGAARQPAPGAGDQSLNLVITVEQTFATEPGHEYVFSGWLAHAPGSPDRSTARADVTLNGQPFVKLYRRDPQASPSHMHWEPFAYRFRAASASTTLSIQDNAQMSSLAGLALDGLAVTPVEQFPGAPPALPPPPENLLVNGSFEAPDVSGSRYQWGIMYGVLPLRPESVYGGPSLPGWQIPQGTIDVQRIHWPSAVGLQSIDLVGSPGTGQIEQSFLTEPGRDYVLSGYLSANHNLYSASVDISLDDALRANLVHLATPRVTEWTFFRLPFRATGPTTKLTISDTTAAALNMGAALDGLAVTTPEAVPAPVPGSRPIPPLHLEAHAVGGQIEVTWDDPNSDETGFSLRRRTFRFSSERVVRLGPNVTRYVDQEVEPGETYLYNLVVQSERGNTAAAGQAKAAVGVVPPGPEGSLLVGSPDGVVRHDPRTGARVEVLAPYGSTALGGVAAMTVGPDGSLSIISGGHRVVRYDRQTGAYRGTLVLTGSGGLNTPSGLAFGPDGNLYVSSYGTHQVLRYHGRTGVFMDIFVPRARGGLERPGELRFGPGGNLYVVNGGTRNILQFNGRTGAFIGPLRGLGTSTLQGPGGLNFGPDRNLYVTVYGAHTVLRYNLTTGAGPETFISSGRGGLKDPGGLAFGPDGDLYVISRGGHNVLRYDGRTGAFRGVFFAGDATVLLFPEGQLPVSAGPPAVPTGLTATAVSPTQVRLTWSAGVRGATGIALFRRTATSDWERIGVVSPSATAYVDTNVQPNTAYTYRIRAHTSTEVSAWSNESSVTTPA